ncbi:MAG TPA: hypothetical protein VI653_27815 [Steroidobacteraceae bacterium]
MSELQSGQIQFYDAVQPGLAAGEYTLSVSQSLSASGASVTPITQPFVVGGPRFTLDPREIQAQYPPPGSMGTFEGCLPTIVFSARLLPWERNIPGLSTSIPWLALLVFGEGELLGSAGSGDYAQFTTVAKLLANGSATTRIPTLTDVTTEEKKSTCAVITVPSALFGQIVPTAAELPLLAHVRQVDSSDKVTASTQTWFSTLFANRFPAAGSPVNASKTIVHVVSLEGFADLIDAPTPVTPPQAQVQLISLASWAFSCLAQPAQTFSDLATEVAAASGVLSLPVPPPSDATTVAGATQQRLAEGYVALGYHASTGEDAFAWYRGPITPVITNPQPIATPLIAASGAMIFDATTGIFDHTYAAAWAIGRALALQSQSYAQALVRLRTTATALLSSMADTGSSLSGSGRAAIHSAFARLIRSGIINTIGEASRSPDRDRVAAQRTRNQHDIRSRGERLRAALANPHAAELFGDAFQEDPDAQSVATWLGGLALLEGVPFVHLVPDARMLPLESVRMGFIDPNWITALLEGALSIGLATTLDAAVQAAFYQQILAMAQATTLTLRSSALGQSAPITASTPLAVVVLHSALVTGWPGLQLSGTAAGASVPLLRFEALSDTVMLAIFNGLPDTIMLAQPRESLAFGVEDGGVITARYLSGTVGAPIPGKSLLVFDPANPSQALPTVRAGGNRVLNISASNNTDLISTLAAALGGSPTIGPAAFALEMFLAPESVSFSASSLVEVLQ